MLFHGAPSILVILSLTLGAAAESYTGRASWNPTWSDNACDGKTKDGTKFIAALNPDQYKQRGTGNNSPVCGNTVTVTYEGKSLEVTIMDMGGTGYGGLDLSIAAFEYFLPLCKGTFNPTWTWNNYDPSSGSKDAAALDAVNVGPNPPEPDLSSNAAAVCDALGTTSGSGGDSDVSSVATSLASTAHPDVPSTVATTSVTAVVAGADTAANSVGTTAIVSVSSVETSVAAVTSVETSVSPVTSTANTPDYTPSAGDVKPTGYARKEKVDTQFERCPAQL